ncbi:hypothetical protein UL204_001395 [Salmonella enterica]|nr:hypothetical protein [Salmonella enterica]
MMMKHFPLVHAVRVAYSVAGIVPCTVDDHSNRFVGLPLLMFTFVVTPSFFTGVHTLIPQLMNMVLLTERSDRDVWRHRSENVLSVNGMVRNAVVGPVPFSPFFAVFYTVQNV